MSKRNVRSDSLKPKAKGSYGSRLYTQHNNKMNVSLRIDENVYSLPLPVSHPSPHPQSLSPVLCCLAYLDSNLWS
jgi:hypothetical protein